MLKDICVLLRPHQWLKNMFIFLPLFFDRHLMDMNYLLPAVIAFFAYSFAASSIYCFNDIFDAEADRLHPKKCKRPIASGVISKPMGYGIMVFMLLLSVSTIQLGHNLLGGGQNICTYCNRHILCNEPSLLHQTEA